jgi:hypothetical protein
MAQITDFSGLAKLGISVATAFSFLVGADAYIGTTDAQSKPPHELKKNQFVSALHDIKASANDVNKVLDQVIAKLLTEPETIKDLNASKFATIADGLRSLEHYIRGADEFKGEPGQRREFLKSLTSIRSRTSDIVSIVKQSKPPESTFDSNISPVALATLAKNGSRYAAKLAG